MTDGGSLWIVHFRMRKILCLERARDQDVVRAEVQAPTEVTGVLVAARDVAGKEKERKVKVKRVRKEKVRVTHHRRQRPHQQ